MAEFEDIMRQVNPAVIRELEPELEKPDFIALCAYLNLRSFFLESKEMKDEDERRDSKAAVNDNDHHVMDTPPVGAGGMRNEHQIPDVTRKKLRLFKVSRGVASASKLETSPSSKHLKPRPAPTTRQNSFGFTSYGKTSLFSHSKTAPATMKSSASLKDAVEKVIRWKKEQRAGSNSELEVQIQ
jgi:hypothetical protein